MEKAGVPVYSTQNNVPPPQYTPPPQHAPAQALGTWTTGLFGCSEDFGSFVSACCFPCVPFAQVANIVDRGATSCFCAGCNLCIYSYCGCPCLYTYAFRSKLRAKYGLPEDPCDDCLVDWCCLYCSIAQQYRELQNRGIDPSLGFAKVRHIYDEPPPRQQMHQ